MLIDLSWVVYPDYVLKDLPSWASLIRKYPKNFVLGSDAVGRFGDYPEQIRIYDALFDALDDPKLVKALATGNLRRIMPRQGIVLDPDYQYPERKYSERALPLP
ncbi:MAG: hypothetical protein IH881_18105 [Myxococcales bacterium]|nr:hypothetical protein [Myxococcales bacterium]